jgi:hypothetical protein
MHSCLAQTYRGSAQGRVRIGRSSTALTEAQTCTSWNVPGLTTIDISDGDMMIVPLLLTFRSRIRVRCLGQQRSLTRPKRISRDGSMAKQGFRAWICVHTSLSSGLSGTGPAQRQATTHLLQRSRHIQEPP